MFSKQFRAVFYILAQAFTKLYHMPADWKVEDEHSEFTGADMMARTINGDDDPSAGSGPNAPIVTNTPAQVFNSGADVAAVFTQPNVTAAQVAAVAHVPEYRMIAAMAGQFTREQFHAQQWTDETLLAHGYMEDIAPKPVAPSIAAAPLPPTAPTVPQPTLPPGAPAASQPAPAPAVGVATAAPAATAPVLLDSDGLPWDARIHSGGRTQTAKGAWVKRKGVQPNIIAQVTAELRQSAPAPAVAFTPLAPAAPDSTPVPITFQELMDWAGKNRLGHLFQATGQAMGLVSFGLLVHETNPERIKEAFNIMQSLRG